MSTSKPCNSASAAGGMVLKSVALERQQQPRRAYFTHIAHDLAHAETNARLPAGVELAYDGLTLEVES